MKRVVICRMKSFIQPFERVLALRELESLAQAKPEPVEGDGQDCYTFEVAPAVQSKILTENLAYWETIKSTKKYYCTQILRESSVNVVRNGIAPDEIALKLPFSEQVPIVNRRVLRYGTHGIHEYRGKFFPQLVRALINIADIPRGGVVADPMCGSGTTLVEAALGGYHAVGADINPLSIMMSRTKCALLSVSPDLLSFEYKRVRAQILESSHDRSESGSYFLSLLDTDREYLQGWFAEHVIRDLDQIMAVLATVSDPTIRDFMHLAVSNILRGVSWQKEADLRVRKEIRLDIEIDAMKSFLEELGRSVRIVLALLYQNQGTRVGRFTVEDSSISENTPFWHAKRKFADVVVTSPPYATALPYLDTDRLSLSYLKLLSRKQHRQRDLWMIGNREITERQRKEYWSSFCNKKSLLPESVTSLIQNIELRNSSHDVGFRRRNLPTLLAKYFLDMRGALTNIRKLLKPHAMAFIVIGNNHTIAGKERVDINTTSLLADIAESIGFTLCDRLPMEMLVSRDIFKQNASGSETILTLKRKH